MKLISDYLKDLLERGGSDLHISANSPPLIRKQGDLVRLSNAALSSQEAFQLLTALLTPPQLEKLNQKKSLDLAYEIEYGSVRQRFRANLFYQWHGLDGAFRVIPQKLSTLKDLGLPSDLINLLAHKQGLVLVTGPSGCGKTTTLAALLNWLNTEKTYHIITIEDPIEYIHASKKSIVHQREVHTHSQNFHSAMRAALREDPDVFVVGELRDLESMRMAIMAAETGHLVLSTLHTSNAVKTIDRLIGSFPSAQQPQMRSLLSEGLKGIISQQLVNRRDGWGRVPAVEILVSCTPIINLIRENKSHQIPSIMQTQKNIGMRLMDEALMELMQNGTIDPQEAYEHAQNQNLFESMIGGADAGKG
jgi:twitching motility protein PilT